MKTLLKILKAPWIALVWLLVLPTRLFAPRPVLSLNLPPPELSLSNDELRSLDRMRRRDNFYWEKIIPSTRSCPIPINAAKVKHTWNWRLLEAESPFLNYNSDALTSMPRRRTAQVSRYRQGSSE